MRITVVDGDQTVDFEVEEYNLPRPILLQMPSRDRDAVKPGMVFYGGHWRSPAAVERMRLTDRRRKTTDKRTWLLARAHRLSIDLHRVLRQVREETA